MNDDRPLSIRAFATLREAPMPGDWARDAACRPYRTSCFFPGHGEASPPGWIKELCASCPVLEPCRAYSLRWPVTGVWAGMSEKQRIAWRTERMRRVS